MPDEQEPSEPGTDLVVSAPAAMGPPAPAEWDALKEQVQFIVRAGALPSALRGKPADIMLVMLTGRELGIGPVQAISKIHVIEGRPTMSAELMLALVLRAGHSCVIEVTDNTRCVVQAKRRGQASPTRFEFSMDDAHSAGLANKDVWKKYPANMLRARCISNACRMVFPDVLMGVSYVPEEMGADVDPFTGEVTMPDEPMITDGQVAAYRERIMALSETYRNELRDTMKERGWVLARLPVRLRDAFEEELSGLEGWESPSTGAVQADDGAVEAVVVGGEAADDEDGASDVAEAEVVDGPTGPHGSPVEPASSVAPLPAADSPAPGGEPRDESPFPPAKPAAPAESDEKPITKGKLQRIAILCREVATLGLRDDHPPEADTIRHAIAEIVSDGRTQSTRELTPIEGNDAIAALLAVKDRKQRLVIAEHCVPELVPAS